MISATPFSLTRRSISSLGLALAGITLAAGAHATPLDGNHRFEHIGRSVSTDVAAIVPVPGRMRALVLQHAGDIRLVDGDGLVNDLLTHISVSQTGAGDGLLDAAWDPRSPGQVLFVTYVAASPRKFTVARLTVTGDTASAPTVLYQTTIPAATVDTGGGVTLGADGKLYVGIGDFGDAPAAGQSSAIRGKILRLNPDAPGGVPADNPLPGSPVYGTGVKNPMRLTSDPVGGQTYFIDVNPAGNEELNVVQPMANYGWSRYTGYIQTTGFVDPIWVWTTAIGPSGLVAYRGTNFGSGVDSYAGDLLVSSTTGVITRIHPDSTVALPAQARETVLFRPGAGEPGSFVDLAVPTDGFAYVSDPSGVLYRLRNNAATVQDPSEHESIVPIMVKKGNGTLLQVYAEREPSLTQFGLYTGNLRQPMYNHPLETTSFYPADPRTAEAYSKFTVDGGPMPAMTYILVSADSARGESLLGHNSRNAPRPGAGATHGCPCPAGVATGVTVGTCAETFTLAWGRQGAGITIGPKTFDTDWDCNVILLDLSQEWCYWCHQLAPNLEADYVEYGGRGFTLLTVISEDANGSGAHVIATQSSLDAWVNQHGSTNPVMLDENRRVLNQYFETATCGGFPETLLFARDGMQTDMICGDDPNTIHADVDREVNR